jgi:hypothetical protein
LLKIELVKLLPESRGQASYHNLVAIGDWLKHKDMSNEQINLCVARGVVEDWEVRTNIFIQKTKKNGDFPIKEIPKLKKQHTCVVLGKNQHFKSWWKSYIRGRILK